MSPLKNTRSLLYLSLFLFLGFGIFTILTPTFSSFAEEVDVDVDVNSVISLALSKDKLEMNIIPTAAGTTGSDSTVATVSTNDVNGYVLSISAKTDETALVHGSDSVSDKITTSGAASLENLAVNNWAYGLDGGTELFAVPGVSNPVNIKTSDTPVNSDTTTVDISTKINSSLASGRYSNTLVFSAVANNVVSNDLNSISSMQDMTSSICSNTPTPTAFLDDGTINANVPTKVLTDSRDGKTYTVAKLADGKCWMTQNLALGGSSPITLTPADSNVTSNRTLKAADTSWVKSTTDPHYWIDSANQTAYGNYYNWPAATIGNGTADIVSADAPQSICPKGWRLPTGGDNGEFAKLITTTYGITNDTTGSTKLQSAPLSFPLTGDYTTYLKNQGYYGYYWSSTAYSTTNNAYLLYFHSSAVNPTDRTNRNGAYAVRCLAE